MAKRLDALKLRQRFPGGGGNGGGPQGVSARTERPERSRVGGVVMS